MIVNKTVTLLYSLVQLFFLFLYAMIDKFLINFEDYFIVSAIVSIARALDKCHILYISVGQRKTIPSAVTLP